MPSSRSHITRVAGLALAALVAAACTEAIPPVPIASIQLGPAFDSLEVGATKMNWLVILRDAAGQEITGRPLTWESNNSGVATVDASSGAVTGVSNGLADITVRSGGKSAASLIRVITPVLSIVVTPDSFDLPLTSTRTINVALVGPGGVAVTGRVITWASSSPGIAVVSASGVVTAVSQGTATIVVSAGTKQANVRVRVVAEPATSVRITPNQSNHVLRLTQSKQLTAECLNASQQVLQGRQINWNSSNPLVATVSNAGLVTASTTGQATITATCENATGSNVSASTQFIVTLVPVSSVTITPAAGLSLVRGTAGQLAVTARDSAGNVLTTQGRTVTWQSDNIPVATVSTQGVVQGVNFGTAQVTVTVTDPGGVPSVTSAPVPIDVHAFFSAAPFDASRRGHAAGLN
jgi:uncharacterized protein YjdB